MTPISVPIIDMQVQNIAVPFTISAKQHGCTISQDVSSISMVSMNINNGDVAACIAQCPPSRQIEYKSQDVPNPEYVEDDSVEECLDMPGQIANNNYGVVSNVSSHQPTISNIQHPFGNPYDNVGQDQQLSPSYGYDRAYNRRHPFA